MTVNAGRPTFATADKKSRKIDLRVTAKEAGASGTFSGVSRTPFSSDDVAEMKYKHSIMRH